jgi:imidazolonepropionase-like amidohydrolase
MPVTIFENAQGIDTDAGTILPRHRVLVEDDRIIEVSPSRPNSHNARRIDLKGRTLM